MNSDIISVHRLKNRSVYESDSGFRILQINQKIAVSTKILLIPKI